MYLKLWAIEELGTIQAMGRFGLDAGERLLQALALGAGDHDQTMTS